MVRYVSESVNVMDVDERRVLIAKHNGHKAIVRDWTHGVRSGVLGLVDYRSYSLKEEEGSEEIVLNYYDLIGLDMVVNK